MNEKEILEYNKRCAEFLDIVTEEPHWVEFNKFMPNSIAMSYGRRHHIEQLQFHSDWNWIMEMVEAIEKLTKQDGYRYEILIINSLCVIEETNKIFDSNQRVYAKTTKEAVIGAINQFLIWYEQNK